jgi:hypothetical protein
MVVYIYMDLQTAASLGFCLTSSSKGDEGVVGGLDQQELESVTIESDVAE